VEFQHIGEKYSDLIHEAIDNLGFQFDDVEFMPPEAPSVDPRSRFPVTLAVAERHAYNPLFVYGGVGMGKTHLMQAIGHETKKLYPHLALRYITSEAFTN